MRYIIIGAGAVGGVIGARLIQGGNDVVLVARGAHLAALRDNGLRLVTVEGAETLPVHAVTDHAELGELRADDVLLLAVKSQDTAAALTQWAAAPVAGGGVAADRLALVCAQNGVENERVAQRIFRTVYGMCVWLPATHLEPGVVVSHTAPMSGILTLGRYPHGSDSTITEFGEHLASTAFLAPVVEDVMRWKYGKLLNNLGNALMALLDDSGEPAQDLWQGARAEGEAVLAAAGIRYADEAERQEIQGDRMQLRQIEGVPRLGGSTWQSLARATGSAEVDYLNGEIALLGRLHAVPTPINDLLQRLVTEYARDRREPRDLAPSRLRAMLG
ncbi:ketopantoate reductase family protein [Nocardia vaccinii]|uniref:ketopantoate reductase family protein n=1 Tax=Nocardia vaccinii TaxID=1822 RepID=UPI00082A42F5|nr:2-dehydropantoate 2-reductase N-terminal domain-containing protein [Nocardia vaccinii]